MILALTLAHPLDNNQLVPRVAKVGLDNLRGMMYNKLQTAKIYHIN